jgi:DNA-binding response OmpR family regulator
MAKTQQMSDLILVVEDDDLARDAIRTLLAGEGFVVDTAADGAEMRARLSVRIPQIVLMDVKLPGEDGFALTRFLRSKYSLGIIILTTKTELIDRVVGLEIGADDYVTKPYQPRELMARIRSLARRLAEPSAKIRRSAGNGGTQAAPREVCIAGGTFDTSQRKLISASGDTVDLTSSEVKALRAFIENTKTPISRESLMKTVFNRDWSPTDRSIDVLVAKLRRKLDDALGAQTAIKAVRGVGYEFCLDVERTGTFK